MAYTKTNLNETTETVAVDMAAEDKELLEELPFDEATETVVEQNARGYSKTVWNENTPITADKLNKMETGIANTIDKTMQIMEIPINHADGWQQFRWTKPNYNAVSWTRDAKSGKALEVLNETEHKQLLLLKDDGGLEVKKYFTVNGEDSTGDADLFLKYNGVARGLVRGLSSGGLQLHSYNGDGTWLNHIEMGAGLITLGSNTKVGGNLAAGNLYAGSFSIENRDLKIHGKRAMVGFDTADGNYLSINFERDFGAGVKIYGLTRTDAIENGGKLTFFNQIGGGQMSSLINCQALQNNTGNGQMMTVYDNRIYLGNPNTHLVIESGSNPTVNVGGRDYQLYHTGNKPTAGDIGALPLSGGTMNGTLYMESGGKARRRIASVATHGGTDLGDNNSRTTIQSNKVPTWWNGNDNRAMLVFDVPNPTDYIVRAGAGFVGAPGYITFSW